MAELHQSLLVVGMDPTLSPLAFLLQIIDLCLDLPQIFPQGLSNLLHQTMEHLLLVVTTHLVIICQASHVQGKGPKTGPWTTWTVTSPGDGAIINPKF